MVSTKYRVTWKTLALPLIGLAAFFIYIYIFNVDILEIIGKVQNINPYLYLLATIASLLDTMFFAVAWYFLLRSLSVRISLVKASLFVWAGIFIDTLIPAESVSGEITKIYLVNKEQDGAAGKATASIVAQRLIGMSINITTLAIGATFLLIERQLYGILMTLVLFLVGLTSLFLVLTLLLCVKESWTMRILDLIIKFVDRISRGRWKLSKLRDEAIGAARAFHSGMKEYVRAPKTLFVASTFSIVSWMLTLAVFYLTFLSIGAQAQISWSAILVISSIFVAVKSIPIGIPFEVGLPEIALMTLLSLFGVPPSIGATATILMRLLTLWLRFFIGFGAQQWIGIKAIITADTSNKVDNILD